MPLRKEPPTPRTAAVDTRLDPSHNHAPSTLGPLIPFKAGQTSLRQQAILTEDEYTSALSSIIKRDFFPELDRITAENAYLAAVEDGDSVRIRDALDRLLRFDGGKAEGMPRKLRRRDVPRATPSARSEKGEWDDTPIASGSSRVFNPTFTPALSTPGPVDVDDEDTAEPPSGITPNLDLSLASFQAQYTSEDNASFAQLLDRDKQERKRKHAHLFAREKASAENRKRIVATEQQEALKGKQLAIEANPDHPKLLQQGMPTLLIEGSDVGEKGKRKQSGKDPMDDLVLVPEPRSDPRPPATGLNRRKYTARNALLYDADANEDHLRAPPLATLPDPKPRTNFAALRFDDSAPTASEVDESDPSWSPSSTRVDAAIARGRAGSLSTSEQTPKVNGYGFVTPYSTPQHGRGEDELRVYNAIKARRAETSGGFELPQYSKRERVAQGLTATPKGGMTPYGQAKYGGLTGLRARGFASPKSRKGGLTPAGKALLDRSTRGGTPLAGQGVASPMSNRTSTSRERRIGDRGWTPTPRHTQGKR
ncbi:Nuclear protein DGCR14 [Kalmanozyma brasiliensis GHG001]|uniref:Protein DGCR14 n=1 Tax=Kalmanozyma brasiliensis (strain GHG001) TaxID=1365824 RepID=V5GL00_KALBG|nr:Nuclear protein DGCR14 [Kalmanozyma brasiliensis GHG001]EST06632.1 Nuclear protein DGCR14 [Kalmanozyma brasiliensis GHG001]